MMSLLLNWLQRRKEAARLVSADADALVLQHGEQAYSIARRWERAVARPGGATYYGRTRTHWRRVALLIARKTGRQVGLDTATRMQEGEEA